MSNKTILIADDEAHVVRSLTFVLQKAGYKVSSASNGEEALNQIRQARPDIVFLDVMMPKKNGYEVCEEIKKSPELKSTHVIILTAKGQESDKEQGIKAGADEFITKPFSPMDIVTKVKNLLG
ncbi:MAG: response regulator [Dehalococcoidales bacterium]|nr:response regulator [Dehalococcoidales bacterium]